MPRLPTPGSDDNQWGDILNEYLGVEHNADGTQKTVPVNKGGTGATDVTSARNNLGIGSAATRDVANSGDATSSQVVKGDDTRLTNERTPSDGSVDDTKITGGGLAPSTITGTALTQGDIGSLVGNFAYQQQLSRLGAGVFQGGLPLALRVGAHQNWRTSSAGESSRIAVSFPVDVVAVAVVVVNWISRYGGDENTNDIYVRNAFEPTSGSYRPIHFQNESDTRQITLRPGETVRSNWTHLGTKLSAGSVGYIRTNIIPEGGTAGRFPIGDSHTLVGYGSSLHHYDQRNLNDATDYTMADMASVEDAGDTYVYAPIAILGIPADGNLNRPIIASIGGSNSAGVGDDNSDESTTTYPRVARGTGWGVIARAAEILDCGHLNFGANGSTMGNYLGSIYNHVFELIASGVTDVFMSSGNDVSQGFSFATIQTNYTTVAQMIVDAGARVHVSTVMPRTNSSNSYANNAGQTAYNVNYGPEGSGGSLMTQVNTWIRTKPAPFTSVVDIANAVGVYYAPNDIYVWDIDGKGNLQSGDGTHLDGNGAALIAQLLVDNINA